MERTSLLISSLVGAVVMVLLSNIPFLNLINCLLCAGLWIGGIVAVWFYSQREGTPPAVGQGAAIGALAGVIGAVISSLIGLLFGGALLATMIAADPSGTLEEALGGAVAAGSLALLGFLISIIIYPAFGALGGLIIASIMQSSSGKAT